MLATRYRQDGSPVTDVKGHFHDRIVDMEPCTQCKEHMKIGVILISIADGERDKVDKAMAAHPGIPDPRRTGRHSVALESAVLRWVGGNVEHPVLKHRWAFIEDTQWREMGLPTTNEDFTHPNEAKGPVAQCKKCDTKRLVDRAWTEARNNDELQARCLTCFPNEGDVGFTLVPHTLLLYESLPKAEEHDPSGQDGQVPNQT